jgi:hypothetical protein
LNIKKKEEEVKDLPKKIDEEALQPKAILYLRV